MGLSTALPFVLSAVWCTRVGVGAHVPRGAGEDCWMSLHCSLPYSSAVRNNCCCDRLFVFSFCVAFGRYPYMCEFCFVLFTHPSLTLSDALGTPSSQQALLSLCLGYGLLSLTALFA